MPWVRQRLSRHKINHGPLRSMTHSQIISLLVSQIILISCNTTHDWPKLGPRLLLVIKRTSALCNSPWMSLKDTKTWLKSLRSRVVATSLQTQATTINQPDHSRDRQNQRDLFEDDMSSILTGLVCLPVPTGRRSERDLPDAYKNDAVLEMAVCEVDETLIIYVEAKKKQDAIRYETELYDLTWDLLCLHGKEHVNVSIISDAAHGADAWEKVWFDPALEAVYRWTPVAERDKLSRGLKGLLPVVYRSPMESHVAMRLYEQGYLDYDPIPSKLPNVAIICGTFDHLHTGHKRLLACAASLCNEKVVIAITASTLLLAQQPFSEFIQPLDVRKRSVEAFVMSVRPEIAIEFQDVMEEWGPPVIEEGAKFIISSTDVPRFMQRKFEGVLASKRIISAFVLRRTHRSTHSSSRIRAQLVEA